ncbi:hypothetical protein KC19_12G137300 [Ceratodon purpureus]|uniref:non-specific serine/threonine protein kinase n=3 Tax=Ceratodon purpureus TaxID=3225 RepID=A0A8T0GB00_CERPU|nr:hypothetical protein KC19_12G137300 [Ceratodon purpureus]
MNSMTNFARILLRQFSYLIILLILGATLSCAQTPVEQGTVLKRITADWGVRFSDWEASADPCVGNWSGVTCDIQTKSRVTHLNLSGQGLRGPIPSTIGELVYLEGLDLANNNVSDPMPGEIGKLVHLKVLNLSTNNFASPPPDALLKCNVLETLLMKENSITGQLPLWIGQLVTLRTLDLSQNKLWGGLPLEYGNLLNLVNMYLWENELSGFLPSEWNGLVNLEILQMGHNYLTGNIPNWLSELPKARDVVFSRNQFYGPASNLTKLIVNGNFTSAISRWLFDCNYLEGDWPTFNVPTVQVKYFSNCWNNETDGCATIGCNQNATQDTPSNCSRIYNCPNFFEERRVSQFIECSPCPPSQFITDGTRCVCGRDRVDKVSKTPVEALIGGVVGGIVVIIFAAILIILICRRKPALKYQQFGRKYEGIGDPWTVPKDLDRFTLQELERATNNFSEEYFIGEGGFGKVYRGVLPDGKVVAIKCASNEGAQGQTEFRNELALLSRLHHRHLCALEGFCDEDGLQLLVYEFMVNGDLHQNLFGKSSLNAAQRFEVAVGIARGLDYLHSFANPPVIHRDIKPSNVLLDEYNVAKLADFGISKATPELHTHISTRPVGTIGYLDPDYFRTNQLTIASDVFAFGIVILELVTGQRVFDTSRLNGINLTDWVIPKFKEGGIHAIIDPRLSETNYDATLFTNLTEVGLKCSKIDRNDRPTMKEVLTILEPYASRALKENSSSLNPKWSTEYFKNKSLFEDSRQFAPNSMNGKPYNSGESSINSHDTNCFSTEASEDLAALKAGFDFEAVFREIL